MHLSWEDAVKRFKISKVHQSAHIQQFHSEMQKAFTTWLDNPAGQSLYLSGNPGSGKTQASVALLKGLIERKIAHPWLVYIRSDELDEELLIACDKRQESYVLEKYHDAPFLFIDDLGVERVNDRIVKQYYSIIDRRLNNLFPTIFTSNTSRDKIANNLGERIASRLQMATEIIFPAQDYRKGFSKL